MKMKIMVDEGAKTSIANKKLDTDKTCAILSGHSHKPQPIAGKEWRQHMLSCLRDDAEEKRKAIEKVKKLQRKLQRKFNALSRDLERQFSHGSDGAAHD